MAIQTPNDPYRQEPEAGAGFTEAERQEELSRMSPAENSPGMARRATMFGIGIAVAMGIIFYAFNNTATTPTQSAMTPSSTSADRLANEASRPAVPPGVRDVTPYNNDSYNPQTTGSAPSRPQSPAK